MNAQPPEPEPDVERWLPVVGFEGLYEVSSWGRIKSLRAWRGVAARIMKPGSHDFGYQQVTLCNEEGHYAKRVHVLVARAFIGPTPPGQEVRHIDGNPRNSKWNNLAYGTRLDNIRDSVLAGTHKNARKTSCARGHLFDVKNTRPKPTGGRVCRACHVINNRLRKERRRAD